MLRPSKDRPACPTASRCTKVFAKVVVALFIGISTSLSATAAEIEEIVVTARSVEESVRDIPVAITAIGGERLEQFGLNSMTDLEALTPHFRSFEQPTVMALLCKFAVLDHQPQVLVSSSR